MATGSARIPTRRAQNASPLPNRHPPETGPNRVTLGNWRRQHHRAWNRRSDRLCRHRFYCHIGPITGHYAGREFMIAEPRARAGLARPLRPCPARSYCLRDQNPIPELADLYRGTSVGLQGRCDRVDGLLLFAGLHPFAPPGGPALARERGAAGSRRGPSRGPYSLRSRDSVACSVAAAR